MTEAEWMQCEDPKALLQYLKELGASRTKKGRRRLRLFGCACCWRIQDSLDAASRGAIEASERFAEGLLSKQDLEEVEKATLHRAWGAAQDSQHAVVLWACHNAVRQGAPPKRAAAVANFVRFFLVGADRLRYKEALRAGIDTPDAAVLKTEAAAQCALLRCLFGEIFCSPSISPVWRTPLAVGLAQSIDDEHAFDRLPILADALEDAGCTDAALLDHLRGPGPHVRGCWAQGLVLLRS
jgi:hypothetical protein